MRIYLQTIPAADESPRYFQLILQRDLIDGWNLIKETGQQGQRGRLRTEHYDDLEAAQAAMTRARDHQLARGFRVVFTQGSEAAT